MSRAVAVGARLAAVRSPVRTGALTQRYLLVAILLGATAIRLGWTVVAAPPPESDFLTFLQTARLIGEGTWWPDAYGWAYQGAGYPLLLAPLTRLGEATVPAILALNVALGVLTVGLVLRLGSSLFGARAGLIAAALVAALPGLWSWTPLIAAENLAVPMLLGIAVLLVERPTPWRWVMIGALTGLLVFVRPSTLFFVVVVACTAIWLAPAGMKRRAILMVAAGVALAMGPLMALNVSAGGPALPVGNNGWEPWLVHNERATGRWFPARERDDYPFRGIQDDPALADVVRAGQTKLALEFALLNPGEFIPGVIARHAASWQTDEAALDLTIRKPTASPEAARLDPILDVVVDRYYVAVLALAFLGIWLLGARPIVILVLILPLAYLLAPVVISEGSARYHVSGLAYLGVLAGGALASRSRTVWAVVLATMLTVWLSPDGPLSAPMLVVAIVGVGAASLTLDLGRRVRRWVDGPSRRWVWVGLAAALVGAQLGLAAGLVSARGVVIDWSLTRPEGWTAYRSGPASPIGGSVRLYASDVPSRFTKVSFPDAAVLSFAPSTRAGDRVGLTRTFPDLDVGTTYVIYLQVLDPDRGAGGDRLTVVVNGRDAWKAPAGPDGEAGWRWVAIPWQADTPYVSIQVERSAISPDVAPEVLVRSVHVYPKY